LIYKFCNKENHLLCFCEFQLGEIISVNSTDGSNEIFIQGLVGGEFYDVDIRAATAIGPGRCFNFPANLFMA